MGDPTSKQQNEVEQFARQHGIKPDEARKLMEEAGPDPAKLTEAVAKAKVGSRHKDSN